jgi:hypothetical protein
VKSDLAEEPGHWRVPPVCPAGDDERANRPTDGRGRPSGLSSPSHAAADAASEVRDGGVGPLDVIAILAARFALQIVLTFRVLTSHPFVAQVEPAKQALAGSGHRHDDLPKIEARSEGHTYARCGRKLSSLIDRAHK